MMTIFELWGVGLATLAITVFFVASATYFLDRLEDYDDGAGH